MSLLDKLRLPFSRALGRSRADMGIGRTSAAVLAAAVLATGLASSVYLRYTLVRDRTIILEGELDRRSQQVSTAILGGIELVRSLAARNDTARAMRVYQTQQIGVLESTRALMALQAAVNQLLDAGDLRAVELRALSGERIASSETLPELPELSVPVLAGNHKIYWDGGFFLRVVVDVAGEDGTAGSMIVDLRVWGADGAIKGTDRLGATGEATLCGLSGSRRVCFPSRFQAAGSTGLLATPATLAADRALAGAAGTLRLPDHRNHSTYTSFQPVEGFGLALIVKEDETEFLAPIRLQMMLGIPVLILLAALGAALIGRQLRPLTTALVSARLRADAEVVSRATAEAEIRLSRRQLQLVADNAPFLIAFLDPNFIYRFANRRHVQWFDRPIDRLIGQAMETVVGRAAFMEYRQAMAAALAADVPQTVFREVVRAGGSKFVELTFVAQRDEEGHLEGYCVTVRDATASVVREQSLLLAARRDPLTGLCNRTSFNERLDQALGTVDIDSRVLAVAYVDLDHFKRVNDSFGHEVGDSLLKELGQRIELALLHSDMVARLGGDEFALIMHLAAPEDVRVVGARLLASIRQPLTIGRHQLRPTASIGFAVAVPGDTASTLLKRADDALYEAKGRGRDGMHYAEGVEAGTASRREFQGAV